MAIGYLTIQARTAHDAVPLGGVQIRVLNRQGNSVYVLSFSSSSDFSSFFGIKSDLCLYRRKKGRDVPENLLFY